jgi:ketosteroid isomerase-like protein
VFKRIGSSLLLATALMCTSLAAEAMPSGRVALTTWLQRYGDAWQARDAGAAGRLFSADAGYHEMPFDAPKTGRPAIGEYWRGVAAGQRDLSFTVDVISMTGNAGVARGSAKFRLESTGSSVELDGVFALEFDSTGSCSNLREWWHVRAGR